MIELAIPGRGTYRLQHLLLDYNGTLALHGRLLDGVSEKLQKLSLVLDITVVTADTFGTAGKLADSWGWKVLGIQPGNEDSQKLDLVQQSGKEKTVAIGNGANDVLMLRESVLGICILGREGAATEAVLASDLVFTDINDALDALLNPSRLVAGLRR